MEVESSDVAHFISTEETIVYASYKRKKRKDRDEPTKRRKLGILDSTILAEPSPPDTIDQPTHPYVVTLTVPGHLQNVLNALAKRAKPNFELVKHKCPKIHMLKSEPQVHPNAKKLFPLKYPAQTPLIIVPHTSTPPQGLHSFLQSSEADDRAVMSKLVVRVYSDPSKPSLLGQHALCVKEGEVLPAYTWIEYLGEVGLDRLEPGAARFYCWDIAYQGQTFMLSAYGNAAALINGVDGQVLKKANVRAVTGYPRVFYRTMSEIIGVSDISKSELVIDYGNLSKNIHGDAMVNQENEANLNSWVVRQLIINDSLDIPLTDFITDPIPKDENALLATYSNPRVAKMCNNLLLLDGLNNPVFSSDDVNDEEFELPEISPHTSPPGVLEARKKGKHRETPKTTPGKPCRPPKPDPKRGSKRRSESEDSFNALEANLTPGLEEKGEAIREEEEAAEEEGERKYYRLCEPVESQQNRLVQAKDENDEWFSGMIISTGYKKIRVVFEAWGASNAVNIDLKRVDNLRPFKPVSARYWSAALRNCGNSKLLVGQDWHIDSDVTKGYRNQNAELQEVPKEEAEPILREAEEAKQRKKVAQHVVGRQKKKTKKK